VILVVGGIVAWLQWPRADVAGPAAAGATSSVASIPPIADAPPSAVAPAPAVVGSASAPPALTTQQIGDWAVVCPSAPAAIKDCFAQQQLRTRDSRQLVVAWTVRRDADGTVHAVWDVPGDVVRERGLVIDLHDGKPKGLPFAACTAQSCTARAVLAPDYLGSIEAAAGIEVAVSASGKTDPVRFQLSSKGLAEALGKLSGG
jgi:invasion protein IalB